MKQYTDTIAPADSTLTPEQIKEDREMIARLKVSVNTFYWALFQEKCGGRFHAFVEWCGLMSEHLKIVDGLIEKGIDAFDMNTHTGRRLPIPEYQLRYFAEKIECIFDGMLEVSLAPDLQPVATDD